MVDFKKNIKGTDLSPILYGKLPPQARDLEEAVLGALMIDKHSIGDVIDILKPEDFYDHRNVEIYRAIFQLFEQSEPIDILTVVEQLHKNGKLEAIGGPYHLTELTNRVASSANSEYHARLIKQKSLARDIIRESSIALEAAYKDETDALELLQEVNLAFSKLDNSLGGKVEDISETAFNVFQSALDMSTKEIKLLGIPSGWKTLDRVTSGWQPPDLIIVAARPAMGKTSFILNIARNIAITLDESVVIFSLEMSRDQLVKRLYADLGNIEYQKFSKGIWTPEQLKEIDIALNKIGKSRLIIEDKPSINIFELRSRAIYHYKACKKKGKPLKMIIVDYLQLMSGLDKSGQNREGIISEISRGLKGIAKELDVPVIALSQLSRAVETRGGDKRPMLSDLRESGAIEQDADMVVFLYRPEYYGFLQDADGNSTVGIAEAIIAKHRNGDTTIINFNFIGKYMRFEEPDWLQHVNSEIEAVNYAEPSLSKNNDDEIF